MAQQKSMQKLKGTVGDATYYKSKDGHFVREKGGINKARMQTDPLFERTRENWTEFGVAGRAGKLIRAAFLPLLKTTADGRVTSRLLKQLMLVVKSDSVNARGERHVATGDLSLLAGFEFNVNAVLGNSLYAPFTATIDRATGQISVAFPSFIPAKLVSAPISATHFRIITAAAEIDFIKEEYAVSIQNSAEVSLKIAGTEAINLQNSVTANSRQALLLVMGIEFYQEVNGRMYLLRDGGFNALSLIKVESSITTP